MLQGSMGPWVLILCIKAAVLCERVNKTLVFLALLGLWVAKSDIWACGFTKGQGRH